MSKEEMPRCVLCRIKVAHANKVWGISKPGLTWIHVGNRMSLIKNLMKNLCLPHIFHRFQFVGLFVLQKPIIVQTSANNKLHTSLQGGQTVQSHHGHVPHRARGDQGSLREQEARTASWPLLDVEGLSPPGPPLTRLSGHSQAKGHLLPLFCKEHHLLLLVLWPYSLLHGFCSCYWA